MNQYSPSIVAKTYRRFCNRRRTAEAWARSKSSKSSRRGAWWWRIIQNQNNNLKRCAHLTHTKPPPEMSVGTIESRFTARLTVAILLDSPYFPLRRVRIERSENRKFASLERGKFTKRAQFVRGSGSDRACGKSGICPLFFCRDFSGKGKRIRNREDRGWKISLFEKFESLSVVNCFVAVSSMVMIVKNVKHNKKNWLWTEKMEKLWLEVKYRSTDEEAKMSPEKKMKIVCWSNFTVKTSFLKE